jgi:maleylacetoacetate isomerase
MASAADVAPTRDGGEAAAAASTESPAKRARTGPAPSDAVTLYSYWRSSCSYRVRIVLALKGVPYEYKAVHLVRDGGEQLKDAYTALNPMREVPTLVVDGHVLTQSTAIVEYLEETHPQPALLPADAHGRAIVRAVCNIIATDIQPVGNLRVLKHVMSLLPGDDKAAKEEARSAWAKHYITAGFAGLEALLAAHAGKYCVGDAVTLADAFLVPQVYNAHRFGVDMTRYPTITRVAAALAELPAFKAAQPSAQPDAEKE